MLRIVVLGADEDAMEVFVVNSIQIQPDPETGVEQVSLELQHIPQVCWDDRTGQKKWVESYG